MTAVPFLNPLKTSENLRFSDVFRGYEKWTLGNNGLIYRRCAQWGKETLTICEKKSPMILNLYINFFIILFCIMGKPCPRTSNFFRNILKGSWLRFVTFVNKQSPLSQTYSDRSVKKFWFLKCNLFVLFYKSLFR